MSTTSDHQYKEMFRSAAECDMRPVAWLVPNYIPRRNITLFHGPGETGKSLMALHHAAKISSGQCLEFDASGEPPAVGHVLILAREDNVEDTIKPRLTLAGAKMSNIHFRAAGQDIRLPEDIEALRWLVRKKRVVLVIIDTLDDFATTSTKNNQSVRKVLNGLGNLAEEEDIAIIVICHWTKQRNNKGSLRNKIAGSFGILSRGRCAYAFVRDPQDRGILMVSTKGNLGGRKPTVLFEVDVQPVQIDGQPVDHPTILYRSTSPITEDDFEGAPSKVDEAVKYLEKVLAAGSVDSRQILKNSPCSRQTLFYAKKQIGVQDFRTGSHEDHRSFWRLPESYSATKKGASGAFQQSNGKAVSRNGTSGVGRTAEHPNDADTQADAAEPKLAPAIPFPGDTDTPICDPVAAAAGGHDETTVEKRSEAAEAGRSENDRMNAHGADEVRSEEQRDEVTASAAPLANGTANDNQPPMPGV